MNIERRNFIMLLGLTLLIACGQPDLKRELIIGDWTLHTAVRQGRPTSTLNGLRFTFTDDSIYTNLPVFENHNYTYSNDTLTILAEEPYSFYVFHVDSAHLNLEGEIRQVHFRLSFLKVKP